MCRRAECDWIAPEPLAAPSGAASDSIALVRRYNRWRRGDESLEMEHPKVIGEALDAICAHAEKLERESKRLWMILSQVRHNAIAIQNVRWVNDGDCGVTRLANCIEEDCDRAMMPRNAEASRARTTPTTESTP